MHGQQNIKKTELKMFYTTAALNMNKKPVKLAVYKVVTLKNTVFSDLIPWGLAEI